MSKANNRYDSVTFSSNSARKDARLVKPSYVGISLTLAPTCHTDLVILAHLLIKTSCTRFRQFSNASPWFHEETRPGWFISAGRTIDFTTKPVENAIWMKKMAASQSLCSFPICKRFVTYCALHSIVVSVVLPANYNVWQRIHYFTRINAIYFPWNVDVVIIANTDILKYEIEGIRWIMEMLHDLTPTKSWVPDNLDGVQELAMILYVSNYNALFRQCKCCEIVFIHNLYPDSI